MKLGPAAMVEVVDVAALHPDVSAFGGQILQWVGVRLAGTNRISLTYRSNADRLDDEQAAGRYGTLLLVSWPEQVGERRIDLNTDMEVAICLGYHSQDCPDDPDAGSLYR